MRPLSHYLAGILVGLTLAAGGCAARSADTSRLKAQLDRLLSELANQSATHQRDQRRLLGRVAALEAELAGVRRRLARRPVEPPPGDGGGPRPDPPDARDRPAPRVTCPSALPDGARKVRHRMRLKKVQKLLKGVKLRRSKALTLSGSGSRTRRVWTGPCFRITLEGGRVASVELDGVKPRRRRRRRRR